LATGLTPLETRQAVYLPDVHEILHWVNKGDPYGAVPENPEDDPQYNHWEYGVQKWLQTQNLPTPKEPTEEDDVHTEDNRPVITIIKPSLNDVYTREQKIIVEVTNRSTYPLSKLDFYVNNVYIGSTQLPNFLFSFTPGEINSINKNNTLKVVATDLVLNRSEKEINFQISE
jgi:hypothetical protein